MAVSGRGRELRSDIEAAAYGRVVECEASWAGGADCPARDTNWHYCERPADHDGPHRCPCGERQAEGVASPGRVTSILELSGWLYDWMTEDHEDTSVELPREYDRVEAWETVRAIRDLATGLVGEEDR